MDAHSIDRCSNIPEAFLAAAAESPHRIVYLQSELHPDDASNKNPRPRRGRTFAETKQRVSQIAARLKQLGVEPGDRVAIISNSRPEWIEADLAVLSLGGVVVAVYPSLPAKDIGYLLFDSGARVVILENQEQFQKIQALRSAPIEIPATEERVACIATVIVEHVVAIENVSAEGVTLWAEVMSSQGEYDFSQVKELSRDDLATLVYTSGTTGAPKGVVQTHGNHLANVRQSLNSTLFSPSVSLIIFLPLAHAFARLFGYLSFLTGAQSHFCAITSRTSSKPDPDSWTRDIREAGANCVPTVPRILEKMKAGIEASAQGNSLKAKLLRLCIQNARATFDVARPAQRTGGVLQRILFFLLTPLRRKIRRTLFGSGFRYAISGGAKLPDELCAFLCSLEIEALQGYGLTETVVATNVNRSGAGNHIGTVGPVLDRDLEQKVEADGEILFRGPNVSIGYYNRPAATKGSWTSDGWFRTGDLGSLSADGYLSVVGRKKELLVSSGGKKVVPELIEQKIRELPIVSSVVLVGDGRNFFCALITVVPSAVRAWAASGGKVVEQPWESSADLRALLQEKIDSVNATLASFETIKRFRILDEDFTVDNGLLTPTLKVRRSAVEKRYHAEIAAFYRGD